MQVDWRGLLSLYRIEWRDRGKNCTKGNVNVACPWCGNDPSFHMGIAEGKEAYYCYREPNRHSGRNFLHLLVKLGISRAEAVRAINKFMRKAEPEAPRNRKMLSGHLDQAWNRFISAAESPDCLRYLRQRGIDDTDAVIEQYDLRFARAGQWTNRLLIPYLNADDALQTWTGRALEPEAHLKYLTQPVSDERGLIYVPDYGTRDKSVLVLTEGPFDALKLSIACWRSPYIIAALTGKQLNDSKMLRLRALASRCQSMLVALDADVSTASAYQIIDELAGSMRLRYIQRAKLPLGYKDPAELPTRDIIPWLNACNSACLSMPTA